MKLKTKTKLWKITGISVASAVILTTAALAAWFSAGGAPVNDRPIAQTRPTAATLPPSPYGPEDFYREGDVLQCSAAETMQGIDVSHHQGTIDWEQVAASGVKFAMVRLGRRGTVEGVLQADDLVEENLRGAADAGLLVGAYFYSQAISEAEVLEEAEMALEILDGRPLQLPLVFDWEQEERTKDVGPETLTRLTRIFCQKAEHAGYRPMIYFNGHQARQLLRLGELTEYPWWLAQYDQGSPFPTRMDMWQYTSTGKVPGIEGNVDRNLLFLPSGS